MNQEVLEANNPQELSNVDTLKKQSLVEVQTNNEVPKSKTKFYQNKKIVLVTLLILSTVIAAVVALTISLNRTRQEKAVDTQQTQEVSVTEKEDNLFVLKPIETKADKIAFISEGNIWTVNPDGTELEQLTNIDYKISATQKEINYYKGSFFSMISWSPDGSHLAAAAINETVKNALESNDGEIKKKLLLTEGYWFPSHLQIYIFDVIKKTSRTINLEDFGLNPSKTIQIRGIDWLPDNNNIFLKLQNSNNVIVNTLDLTITPIKVPSTVVRGGLDTDLYEAYMPEVAALFSDSIFHSSAKNVQITGTRFDSSPIVNSVVYELPGERQRSFVVPGNNGNIYFHTLKNGFINLHKYNLISKQDDVILRKPDCDFSAENPEDICLELPNVAEGFTSTFDEYFISPNGKYVVARVNNNDNTGIYSIEDMKLIHSLTDTDVDSFKWSSDGESILQLINRKQLSVVNLENGKEVIITNKQLDFFQGNDNYDWNSLH